MKNEARELIKYKDEIAKLTDTNQLLNDQIKALEDQVEDLIVQLDDCENGTNDGGFIDPVSSDDDDENDIDDLSFQEICIKQQEELDRLLSEFNSAVDERDKIIATLKETAKHRDSIIESLEGTIKSLDGTIKTKDSIIESLKETITVLPIMQSRIDKREILLWVHRDGRTLADAVREFSKTSGRPVADIEKLFKNKDI